MPKKIKIALASSVELAEDRKEFEAFINRQNKALVERNVFLELIMWEDFIDAMTKDGLQKEYNKAMQNSDIFVMLFFTKVGKFTLEEFESAFGHLKEHGKPLVYTYFKDADIKTGSLDEQDTISLLDFKKKLKDLSHYTSKYTDIGDLKYQFGEQLDKVMPRLIPDISAGTNTAPSPLNKAKEPKQKVDIYHLPKPSIPLVGRVEELRKIEAAFNDYNTHIFAIIAAGGIGKSALVDEWLSQLKTKNSKLKTIFGWSFYSQGTHDTQTSSGQFFEQALPFFGPGLKKVLKEQPLTDDTEKGRQLAELLREKPSLLILDGVEPLQNKAVVDGGRFKDVGLAALLRDVERNGLGENSLLIISSRQPLIEMANSPNYQALDLQSLSTPDGIALLRSLQVQGLQNELETAVKAYGGRALALVLLGNLLAQYYDGDVNQHERLPILKEKQGQHAERVMSFYDQYWGEIKTSIWQKLGLSKAKLQPEQIFLRLLGLFDRPMDMNALNALIKKAEFARPLAKLSEKQWKDILNNLHKMALLPEKHQTANKSPRQKNISAPHSNFSIPTSKLYDTHPLIRTYFGEQFQNQSPSACQQAHLVLFEYFQTVPEKNQPDTLEELEPLYRAVVHGCLAGEYKKAREDVYRERILRGSKGYTLHKLGAYAQDLTAIAAFFPQGWEKPVSKDLSEALQGFLLSDASFCLMSLGRLAEAVEPRRAHLKISEKIENWKEAAIAAENLVDLLLPLGQLKEAKQAAEQAIDFADRTDDWSRQMISRTKLATTLHRQGELAAALKQFEEAEKIQKESQPEHPKLYSLRGAQYCALLLDLAKDGAAQEAVLERGQTTLKWADNFSFLLDIALDHLTIARALFSLQRFDQAKDEFDQAVSGMREAKQMLFIPVVLLERAKFHCQQKDFKQSQADLDEAQEIIARCGMKLYAADAALLQGNLNLDQDKAAHTEYQMAKELIEETNYHLRKGELVALGERLK
jgi:tetratricopeptide (TPR) repeat protein